MGGGEDEGAGGEDEGAGEGGEAGDELGACGSDADCPATDPVCSEFGFCQCECYKPGDPECWGQGESVCQGEMAMKEQMMIVRILLVRIQKNKLMRRKMESWVRTKKREHLRVNLVM